MADYAYDTLGRRIRFLDHVTEASTVTTNYYDDGQNQVVEDDGQASPTLRRYFVHGSTYIDERAVMHNGDADEGDDYYYLLRELCSVDGPMHTPVGGLSGMGG